MATYVFFVIFLVPFINAIYDRNRYINFSQKREGGGHVKCYPCEKGGGAEKVLTMLKRGHNKF